MEIKRFSFENRYYRDSEWAEFISERGTVRYKDGSAIVHGNNPNLFAVYDGAINYMGDVSTNGDIHFGGNETEYKRTFLESARDTLKDLLHEA